VTERKYLPTAADLIDRLSICLMKKIFIGGYDDEIKAIMHDLNNYEAPRESGPEHKADFIYAILILMLANRTIWENESIVRQGGYSDPVMAQRLVFTHSINGVRTRAKNRINNLCGERIDHKVDCLAADLPPEFGNWDVFSDS
jgi:hypothetical protein